MLAGVPPPAPRQACGTRCCAIIAVGRKDAAAAAAARRAGGRGGTRLGGAAAGAQLRPPARDRPRRRLRGGRRGGTAGAAGAAAAGAAGRDPPDARRDTGRRAGRANEAVELGGGPLAQIVLGYAELAALRGARGEAAFRRALQEESRNPLALLGLGLAQIKQGDLGAGHRQIENAVAHDPSSSLLRSYLGQGLLRGAARRARGHAVRDRQGAGPERSDAVVLRRDPDAARQPSRSQALRDLERSIELNDNRAPFRSRLLLDQDRAAAAPASAASMRTLASSSWASTRRAGR